MAIAVPQASWGCAPALPNRIQGVSLEGSCPLSADSEAILPTLTQLFSLEIGFMKITFSSIHKTHTGTTLSVCVFLFAIFLKNYLTNRKTYAIIKVLCEFFTVRGVTQLGRVLALGARCRRFESCRLDHIVPNILSNPSAGCFFVLQFFDKNRPAFSFFCYITGKLLLTKTRRKNYLVLKSLTSVFKKQGKSEKSA